MSWIIFDGVTTLIEAGMFFWFFEKIAKRKKSRLYLVLGICIFILVMCICELTRINVSSKLVICLTIGGIYVYLLYQIEWEKTVLAVVFYLIGTIVSESMIIGFEMGIHGIMQSNVFLSNNAFRVQSFFIGKVILLLILFISLRFFTSGERRCEWKELVLLIMQAICFSMTIFVLIEVSFGENVDRLVHPFFLTMLALICLCTYFVSFQVTSWFFELQRKNHEKIQLEAYRKRKYQYYQMKRKAEDDVRRIYHDLNNHLQAISDMQEMKLDGLEEYVCEIRRKVEPYERYHNSGNDVVDMMLLDKKELAEKKGIQLNVRIEERCMKNYNTFLLCTIFGNAIDNAIEAVENYDEKWVSIQVALTTIGLNLYFENPTKEFAVYGNCRNTRKRNMKRHGFGMGNIERSVKELGGRMNVQIEDGKFKLYILIDKN